MPVVVFRGLEGWCDRLQVLCHCFTYCSKFNSALCVDWDDGVWGAGELDFYTCFDVIGLKTMTKQQVLKLVSSGRMDIRPKCWTPQQMAVHLHNATYDDAHIGEFMKFEIQKCEGDVLVTNGKGDRTWDLRTLPLHLRFKPKVMEGIKNALKDFDPNSVVVHLRGTDRPDAKGGYLEKSVEALKDSPYQIFVVTDQRDLWEQFHKAIPKSKLVNPNSNILKMPPTNERGTHQTEPSLLRKMGIRKWDMMVDLLADWVALVSARMACGRSESTYFAMARGFNALGEEEWSKVFGGWVPFSKSLQEYNEAILLSGGREAETEQVVVEVVPSS